MNPTSLTLYAYQVGFGDCFLLRFNYPGDVRRHVLIDFGSMGMPKGRCPGPAPAGNRRRHQGQVRGQARCGGRHPPARRPYQRLCQQSRRHRQWRCDSQPGT
nr:hypothetical protein [Pseudomonas sp. BIGb0427]